MVFAAVLMDSKTYENFFSVHVMLSSLQCMLHMHDERFTSLWTASYRYKAKNRHFKTKLRHSNPHYIRSDMQQGTF